MNYEQFREQCAQAAASEKIFAHGVKAFANNDCADRIADKIRALPLPESKCFGWIQFVDGSQTQNFARDEMELATMNEMVLLFAKGMKVEYIPVFSAPPDTEALRKENAELREVLELAKNGLQWYQDNNPEAVSETDYETMERIDTVLKGGEA